MSKKQNDKCCKLVIIPMNPVCVFILALDALNVTWNSHTFLTRAFQTSRFICRVCLYFNLICTHDSFNFKHQMHGLVWERTVLQANVCRLKVFHVFVHVLFTQESHHHVSKQNFMIRCDDMFCKGFYMTVLHNLPLSTARVEHNAIMAATSTVASLAMSWPHPPAFFHLHMEPG